MIFYKYVVPERIDVLLNGMIRFTQPTALNDPFELRPYFDTLISEEQIWQTIGQPIDVAPVLIEVYEKQSPEIKSRVSLDAFIGMMRSFYATPEGQQAANSGFALVPQVFRAAAPAARETIFESMASRIGVLSLSSDCTCTPMWAHYAANHEGLVIGFDGDHPFFQARRGPDDEFFYLRQVVYEPPMPGRALLDLESRDVLLRKDPSWSYEREWRMLAPVQFAARTIETGGEPIHLFAFPGGCVTEVILGTRSSAELSQAVTDLVARDSRYRHVIVKRAAMDASSPRVLVTPL